MMTNETADEPDQRDEGPEACADTDISYWED